MMFLLSCFLNNFFKKQRKMILFIIFLKKRISFCLSHQKSMFSLCSVQFNIYLYTHGLEAQLNMSISEYLAQKAPSMVHLSAAALSLATWQTSSKYLSSLLSELLRSPWPRLGRRFPCIWYICICLACSWAWCSAFYKKYVGTGFHLYSI